MPKRIGYTILHALRSGLALTQEGEQGYDTGIKRMEWHDGVRERGLSPVGFQPYAYPVGAGPNLVTTTAQALAAAGGSLAVPVVLEGHMLVNSVSFWNTDAATARGPVEVDLYEDRANNAAALNLVASGALAAFTPTAAALRTVPIAGAPVYLPPGLYWLVLKNNNAAATLGLGSAAGGTMAQTTGQTKALGAAALGATLDFVAATWAKVTYLPGVRLNGQVFGQAAAF